ncbi:TetR/AcrR family transcriptional regulator [Branchiibius sp. NY16-3462-2]|uniref:TetR/AcrR family transcriptional regulator n=1 Tax=Branchiibius sp. NY16-3462-2 TaxID=1807500 RepID=UPI000A842207|nr:TetR/AcrR family transcriptional regulator [Branchiibius sp. NY16-3462-2]
MIKRTDPHAPGPRRKLSADRLITETLALVDEQGIAAASMRTVARRLDVQVMTLYRYVDNREDLFDAVVDHIVDELDDDPDIESAAAAGQWRPYLTSLAWGVRRYALTHPHAFPLVATRPPQAPWINPPLRSLRWIEQMLQTLAGDGFSDEHVLYTYRCFNSFLLGYLLLETSAMVIADPKPGDGSFQAGDDGGPGDPVDSTDPVPGSLSPTRTEGQREDIADCDTSEDLIAVDPERYPLIHRLREGLTEDHFEEEFRGGLELLLDRIEEQLQQHPS